MTFFLHWIDIGTTEAEWLTAKTWNAAYAVSDEEVLSVQIDHEEGQVPSMMVQVKNPKVGLLSAGRKTWAWFSWDGRGYAEPLFFGRLVAIPSDLLGEAVTLQFTARSKNYVVEKQIASEGLKVRPYYDPVFIDLMKRDDPDSILEGYSSLWHVDRVSLALTPSDILIGEDGNSIFLEGEVPYDSVTLNLNQTPLIAVAVKASVSWRQEYTGFISPDDGVVKSYSGDGIIADWPRPASSLGAGWTVMSSIARDLNRLDSIQNVQYSTNYQNNEKNHNDGDTLSYTASYDYPNFTSATESIWREISRQEQIGIMDPHTLDVYGNVSPTNIPASLQWNRSYVPLWRVKYTMGLRYDADRQRTERIEFILQADAQPILANARIAEDTDNIEMTGADVGEPIISFRNWTSVAGQRVNLGEFVFPDDPQVAGQKSIQVCVVAGIAGTTIPTFSNIAGQTTQDGSVVWSSLGYASGIYNISTDWQQQTLVPLGEIILPHVPFSIPYKDYVAPGRIIEPPTGISVELYFIVSVPNKGYYQCSMSGQTGTKNPDWKTSLGSKTTDGTVEWTFIGTVLPTGVDYYICTNSGTTGETLPPFGYGETLVNDNTVVWTKLAATEVPIGGSPGRIGRNDYFPTDRGRWSIEYLMCLARARLRLRSRAVEVGFECRFERALQLSCRMNATLYDPRLPGGVASGKVIGYSLIADGDKKVIYGRVKIGCSIGRDTYLSIVNGTPEYVDDEYVQPAYQTHDGVVAPIADDMGYTPPVSNMSDPFNFPLTPDTAFLNGGFVKRGSLTKQEAGILSALNSAWMAANYTPTSPANVEQALLANELSNEAARNSVDFQLQKNPIWLELELLPVAGGTYDNFYSVETTTLNLPKTIDLETSSSATPPSSGSAQLAASATLNGVSGGQVNGQVPFAHAVIVLAGDGTVDVTRMTQTMQGKLKTLGAGSMTATVSYMIRGGKFRGAGTGNFGSNSKIIPGGAASFLGSGLLIVREGARLQIAASMAGAGSLTAVSSVRAAGQSSASGDGSMIAVGS